METLKADYRFFVYANKTTKQFIINRAEGYKRDGKWTLTYWITVKRKKFCIFVRNYLRMSEFCSTFAVAKVLTTKTDNYGSSITTKSPSTVS